MKVCLYILSVNVYVSIQHTYAYYIRWYSQVSLFALGVFCKVTEPLLLRENIGLDFGEPLVTFSSANQYITLFHVTIYLIYALDSLALNFQPTV